MDGNDTAESKKTTAVVSEKAIFPFRVPPSGQLPIVDHYCLCRRHCRESRFAPYPLPPLQGPVGRATASGDMFKRAFPSSDAMATNQAAAGYIPTPPPPAGYVPTPPAGYVPTPPAGYVPTMPTGYIPTPPPVGSIATPPTNVPFSLQQFGHQQPPGFTAFTPDYQHFPYTFSSITPPAYSWANTNSTHVMKCVTAFPTTQFVVVMTRRHLTADLILYYFFVTGSQDQVIHCLWIHPHTIPIILGPCRNAKSIWTPSKCFIQFCLYMIEEPKPLPLPRILSLNILYSIIYFIV